jgi:hypothetical protein
LAHVDAAGHRVNVTEQQNRTRPGVCLADLADRVSCLVHTRPEVQFPHLVD